MSLNCFFLDLNDMLYSKLMKRDLGILRRTMNIATNNELENKWWYVKTKHWFTHNKENSWTELNDIKMKQYTIYVRTNRRLEWIKEQNKVKTHTWEDSNEQNRSLHRGINCTMDLKSDFLRGAMNLKSYLSKGNKHMAKTQEDIRKL